MIPRAAAPHSTASICRRVGVATLRFGGGGGAGRASIGSSCSVTPRLLDAQRPLDARDHVGVGLAVVHHHRGLAEASAADLLVGTGGGGPLEAVGLVGGVEGEA